MIVTIDMRDRIILRAKKEKRTKYIKRGLRILAYGYIGTKLVLGGIDAIVDYGKATVLFKGIDIVTNKIMGV